MSACTYTSAISQQMVWGSKRVHIVTFTISSYGTAGLPITTATTGLASIDQVIGVVNKTKVAAGPVQHVYNKTTQIVTFLQATNSEVTDATAFVVDVIVMGG